MQTLPRQQPAIFGSLLLALGCQAVPLHAQEPSPQGMWAASTSQPSYAKTSGHRSGEVYVQSGEMPTWVVPKSISATITAGNGSGQSTAAVATPPAQAKAKDPVVTKDVRATSDPKAPPPVVRRTAVDWKRQIELLTRDKADSDARFDKDMDSAQKQMLGAIRLDLEESAQVIRQAQARAAEASRLAEEIQSKQEAFARRQAALHNPAPAATPPMPVVPVTQVKAIPAAQAGASPTPKVVASSPSVKPSAAPPAASVDTPKAVASAFSDAAAGKTPGVFVMDPDDRVVAITLARWAKAAQQTLIWDYREISTPPNRWEIKGKPLEAIDKAIAAMVASGVNIKACSYPNAVIRVVADDQQCRVAARN